MHDCETGFLETIDCENLIMLLYLVVVVVSVCSVRVVGESDIMQEFLSEPEEKEEEEDNSMKVELRIRLPDNSLTTVAVQKSHKTTSVYKVQYRPFYQHLGNRNRSVKGIPPPDLYPFYFFI